MMETNESGEKFDKDKTDWSLVDFSILEEFADVLTFGAKKYAPENWKKVPEAKKRYFSALIRHLTAWQRGEKQDPESGKSHLSHALCNIYFLLFFDKEK